MNPQQISDLEKAIQGSLNNEENVWLNQALKSIAGSNDAINDLLTNSAVVKRKITSSVTYTRSPFTQCDTAETIRILLLVKTFQLHPSLYGKASLKTFYQAGDNAEKCAFLKGLVAFDDTGLGVNLAINAVRCNSLEEFSAIALSNGYPASHFPELNFNQMVLKALFLDLNICSIVGLEKRITHSLTNMCFSYVIEQALAERIPPASIWLAIKPKLLSEEHKLDFKHYATHFHSVSAEHQLTLEKLREENKGC